MQLIELLWPAFLLAILLVFIHALFGLEIIKRGVIFTDLAIGQIAAIGMALSVTFFEGRFQTPLTLLFALIGGCLIAWAIKQVENVEAFIGLLYAFGISSIMLILAKSSEGMELFSKLSAADILFVSKEEVLSAFLYYLPIAGVMFYLYPRMTGFKRELLFFSMLALMVTSSVQFAGVLVVFALLVAPAFVGLLQKRLPPLLMAWLYGFVAVVVALVLSYFFDLPTGYSIIFINVLFALVSIFIKRG